MTVVPAASQTACLPLGVDGRCPAWVSTEDGGDFDITTAVTTAPDGTAVYAAGTAVGAMPATASTAVMRILRGTMPS